MIGGGIIGAFCAWHLSAAGRRVTIVDRDRFGAACSHGNCGYVCPSHVFPLAQPGAVSSTMKAMVSKNSPFAVKLRPDLDAAKWFLNFARSCTRRKMMGAAVGRHALLQSSMQQYQSLVKESRLECEWQERGLLFVFDTEEEFNAYRQTDERLRKSFDVSATPYSGDDVLELEPALKPGVGGGWHYERDCHLRPDRLMTDLRERLESRGVEIVEFMDVKEFRCDSMTGGNGQHGGRGIARAVSNGAGGIKTIEADQFVVATGAMTPFLNDHLGCRIPIQPGKGYSLTMPTPERMPKIPIIFDSSHVAVTPMQSGYRIGSTMEFVGYDTSINPQRLKLLRDAAVNYLVDPYCDPVEEEWFGWRPMVWDGKPIIDRSPAMKNVWIAAGHSMLGLSMAPATGQLLRELMLHEQPHIDPAHFSVSRFGRVL